MTLERALLIFGRIFSVLFALLLVIHLVLTIILTSAVSAGATTPQMFVDNLQEENFQAEVGSAALAVVLEALPPDLQFGSTSINTEELVNGLLSVDWRTLAEQLGSGDFVSAFLSDILNGVLGSARSAAQQTVSQQAALLSQRLSGRPGYEIAQAVVAAVQVCTQDQIDRLLAAAESSNFTAIDFICNPTVAAGNNLPGVMRDIVIIGLGGIANALAERAQTAAQGFVQSLQIETPVGTLSLEWPEVVVAMGRFSVNIPLPEQLVNAVDTLVSSVQGRVSDALTDINTRVDEAQSNLEALATEIAADAQGTATALAPTATPIPTATPVPEPGVGAQVSAAIDTAVSDLTVRLETTAGSINNFLWGAFLFDAFIFTIAVLFMLRRWSHMGLWAGITLAAGGIGVLLVNAGVGRRLTAAAIPPSPSTIPEVAQLQTMLRTALVEAINAGFDTRLLVIGLVLLAVGVLLFIAGAYPIWQRRRAAQPPTAAAAGELPSGTSETDKDQAQKSSTETPTPPDESSGGDGASEE